MFRRARMARDECGLEGTLTYTNGMSTFVDVTATGEVRAGLGLGLATCASIHMPFAVRCQGDAGANERVPGLRHRQNAARGNRGKVRRRPDVQPSFLIGKKHDEAGADWRPQGCTRRYGLSMPPRSSEPGPPVTCSILYTSVDSDWARPIRRTARQ
jgi:hypothetical protein